jgi:outer membrane protein TolC
LAETQRLQAEQGMPRALAALREALGLGSGVTIDVPPGLWTEPKVRPVHDDIVVLALSRRGEVVQAGIFVDVTCLEVEAQGTCCMIKRMDTFAASADIHSQVVPQGISNTEYRPGAIHPEMPVSLAGSRAERMRRAQDFNIRASAVLDTVRNLITLEAEDAYLRWEQAAKQVSEARDAADNADKLAEDLTKDFTARLKVKIEDVINSRVLAAQARAQYNEFLYKEILALADLERVTAGGFSAGLVELTNPAILTAPEKSK